VGNLVVGNPNWGSITQGSPWVESVWGMPEAGLRGLPLFP
jgi:hypothetical protein